MISPKKILTLVNRHFNNLSTPFYNKFLTRSTNNYLKIGSFQGSNFGTDLCGYLKFSNLLDKKTGHLKIPKKIKQIKLDIGLSFAAPNSALWLSNFPDRIVYGFEPNPENVREIISGENRKRGNQYRYVNLKDINKRFFLLNVAIDNYPPQFKKFYMTREDPGTSSLHKPKIFKIKESTMVPCVSLSDFLSLIPWNRFKYIEHIKIDTQGNDLKVLQSAGKYLSEKVVFVTAECTAKGYNYSHTKNELDVFMENHGFEFIEGTDIAGNKTYRNRRYRVDAQKLDYSTENR